MPCPPPGDLPNPRIEPRSPTFQADSLPSEPPGNSKNTGVGILSFLQGIFLTQKLNRSVLHCRQILYQLSYQGSPNIQIEGEVAQSCLTLCDPVDCSLPGFSVHGILQARILEWIAISFSRGIFPTQGSNPGLLHCRQMLYPLNHQGKLFVMPPQKTIQTMVGKFSFEAEDFLEL